MNSEDISKRLPAVAELEQSSFLEWADMSMVEAKAAKVAIEACIKEIEFLDSVIEKLGEFAATCVITGAEDMAEAEKWEWVARQYEQFCFSHSWMPTSDYLIEQYEASKIIEETEKVFSEQTTDIYEDIFAENNVYSKQATPIFEE